MVERQEVEALLAAVDCDDPWWFTKTEMVVIAALCRAWLAIDNGQVETVREAKFFDGHRVGKLIATAPEHMIGQRVRLVPERGEVAGTIREAIDAAREGRGATAGEPTAWRIVRADGSRSNWKDMPARKLRPVDGRGARIEFAYLAPATDAVREGRE